jgi:hypothetical protein
LLARFNKQTIAAQNVLTIRLLSALGVPTRFTYLTFDPLMAMDELRATHTFQARTDLLLRPQPGLDPGELVTAVADERFVAEHRAGLPFYTGICYMLVSMECLTGSAYTRRVQAAGLSGPTRPSMGRVDARYADWRIGRCSHHAQLWIDRNFVLDYTLKSLEKVQDGVTRHALREARGVIKAAAFQVLGDMIQVADTESFPVEARETVEAGPAVSALDARLLSSLDGRLNQLREAIPAAVDRLADRLPQAAARTLVREHDRWQAVTGCI